MALITIGATALPNPIEYEISRSDLDSEDTGRSESGYMRRDRVRAGIYKVRASFLVSKANLKVITDPISAASFSATVFDPYAAADPTLTMYVGDRSAKLSKYVDEAHPADSYWELTFSLVEF